jgi:protein O-mannosyl-transferase
MKKPIRTDPQKKGQSKPAREQGVAGIKKSYSNLAGLTAIILLGLIIYSNSFSCSFHFDDLFILVGNRNIRDLADVKAWWYIYPSRPFGMLTFALNYHFSQLNVTSYHIVNLIIHLVNACLVWQLTFLILSSPVLRNQQDAGQKKTLALFTALLFVSHPLATQSVTYIIQRFASLAALYYLLSLVLYVKARMTDRERSSVLLFTGSAISAILAMLTKEIAFTLPGAILLLEMCFLRTRKVILTRKEYGVIALVSVLLITIAVLTLMHFPGIFKPIKPVFWGNSVIITPVNYLFTQFSVIVKYIQLLVIPIHQNVDYDFPVSENFFAIQTFLGFLLLTAIFILAVLLYKKQRILSFGILWFFLTLSVESGIIPIMDVIFEHRTYLPSYGFFLILSWGIYTILWKKFRFIAITLFAILIASNSYLTFERNTVWKSEVSLWSDAAMKSPMKARPVYNLGIAHVNDGQPEMAVRDFTRLIEIKPQLVTGYSKRGDVYIGLGQWDQVAADFSKVIELDPASKDAYYNRGIAFANLGLFEKAIGDYSKTLDMDPGNLKARLNRGVAYLNTGQKDRAMADFTRTIEIDPKYADAYYNRGIAYYNQGQADPAIADYTRAIGADPHQAAAYSNRGVAYASLGKWDQAIGDYSQAIGINPGFRDAYLNRGIAYSSLGRWNEAVSDFSRALEIDPSCTMAYSRREFASAQLARSQ